MWDFVGCSSVHPFRLLSVQVVRLCGRVDVVCCSGGIRILFFQAGPPVVGSPIFSVCGIFGLSGLSFTVNFIL